MDRAYYVWLGIFAVGGLLGLFLRPKVVGIFVVVVLGLLVAGFAFGALTGSETVIWVTGVALMAAPVLGAILFAGSATTNAIVESRKRARKDGSHEG